MFDTVKLSVRALVEYGFRSGSLDAGFRAASTLSEGTKAHQKLQKQYGERDRKEVALTAEIPYGDDLVFLLEGRCDGLLDADGLMAVDEIKSTVNDVRQITEDSHPEHWAQAVCYAYMHAREQQLDRMKVQLTYVHVDSEEQIKFHKELTFAQLDCSVQALIAKYAPYARLRLKHGRERDESIRSLAFPFEAYREGQRKLAGSVYKSIADGKKLFARAPTGTGKTMSTIFPSVKAIGEGLLQRFYYLTAKTITRTAEEEAFSIMLDNGLHLHVVTITAKEKVCFQEEMRCSKQFCEYADGYYDRINEAVLDVLTYETLMDRNVIERYARKHRVCPFEFSLDAAYAADAVICDYNYIFDPRISLKRLFEEQKRQTALLIDEAHNLVDRAREMFSSTLTKSDFLNVQREWKGTHPGVYQAAKAVNQYMIGRRKQFGDPGEHVEKERPEFAGRAGGRIYRASGACSCLLRERHERFAAVANLL